MSERERFGRVVSFLNEINRSEDSDRDFELEGDLEALLQAAERERALVAENARLHSVSIAAAQLLNIGSKYSDDFDLALEGLSAALAQHESKEASDDR